MSVTTSIDKTDPSLRQLLAKAGCANLGRSRADCPLCEHTNSVSFDEERGVFKCHTQYCEFSGNATTLARQLEIKVSGTVPTCCEQYHLTPYEFCVLEYMLRVTSSGKSNFYGCDSATAAHTSLPVIAVRRARASLVRKGWLILIARGHERGHWRTNEYTVLAHNKWAEAHPGACDAEGERIRVAELRNKRSRNSLTAHPEPQIHHNEYDVNFAATSWQSLDVPYGSPGAASLEVNLERSILCTEKAERRLSVTETERVQEQNASEMLATCKQNARPETETDVTHKKRELLAPHDEKSIVAEPLAFAGRTLKISQQVHNAFALAFPTLDLSHEYAKADAWMVSNPGKRKKYHTRFMNNWLSRAQERADFRSVRKGGLHDVYQSSTEREREKLSSFFGPSH